ncbi:GCY28-like protein [Mya arenaria]|uniref:guanylate cyclase n=1 Tax=Mya arenaria TaxID=6604 RepID=A0ABY7ET49_MYAAR|nr:GCY28-like protein [Mya arenaria]
MFCTAVSHRRYTGTSVAATVDCINVQGMMFRTAVSHWRYSLLLAVHRHQRSTNWHDVPHSSLSQAVHGHQRSSNCMIGMTFLHNSPLLVHGHLTSANCVVDSKFSLKITDYGPHELLDVDRLKGYELAKEGGETINLRKMLWVAPEHIDAQLLQASSSQAGDVYSFAIILHELIMRCEPFDETGMEVEDILRQLRTRVPAVLRPSLGDDEQCAPELRNLATNCWNDTPEDRPSFNDIEEIYKKIRRCLHVYTRNCCDFSGKKTNIMDNLLQRMSDYADNLEQLAADRTQAYLAEKDKVEELLHRLLPPDGGRAASPSDTAVSTTCHFDKMYIEDVN